MGGWSFVSIASASDQFADRALTDMGIDVNAAIEAMQKSKNEHLLHFMALLRTKVVLLRCSLYSLEGEDSEMLKSAGEEAWRRSLP